jgi:hypothetical protein
MQVSDDMLLENSEQWQRCMVGFFPGFRMPYHAINTIASRVWKQCGLENVTTTSNGFMIFRFTTEAQMHGVLEKGPWMFGGKNIVLQQWHPQIQLDKNKISTLPVWIRLHGLPFPLWSKQGLSLAASMVGRPLSCDESTYSCTRLEYARLCVEIDASLPYVHEFDIESTLSKEPLTVRVEYEWTPSRCAKCCVFGHSCPTNPAPAPTKPAIPVPAPDQNLNKGKATAIDPAPPIPMIHDPLPSTSVVHQLLPSPIILPTTTQAAPPQPKIASPQPILHTDHAPLPSFPAPLTTGSSLLPINLSTQHSPTEHSTLPNDFHSSAQPNFEPSHNNADSVAPSISHLQPLDTTNCMESKMASLQSHSDASSAVDVLAETSTASIPPCESHDDSPTPSPKTVRKKKGGRKRKEVKGL